MRSTKNYDLFKYLDRNRPLSNQHLKELEKSVKEDNRLPENPIIVNEAFEIIDGQHRLAVAKKLGLPIYYVVAHEADMDTVVRLQIQRGWSAMDYITNWEKAGKVDYGVLRTFVSYYGLPITTSAKLLIGGLKAGRGSVHGGGYESDLIRSGKFKVTDLKNAQEFAEKYKQIYNLIKKPFARSRTFIIALQEVFEGADYDHERMLKKLKHFANKMTPQQSTNEYLRDLERVYNTKARDSIRLF